MGKTSARKLGNQADARMCKICERIFSEIKGEFNKVEEDVEENLKLGLLRENIPGSRDSDNSTF